MHSKIGHKLEIRPYTKEELGREPMPLMGDLSIKLDGLELRGLQSLSLYAGVMEATVADMSFEVGEIEIDAGALLAIEAVQKAKTDA